MSAGGQAGRRRLYHVVSTLDFGREDVERLMDKAEQLRTESRERLRRRLEGAVVASLFYEPSTRTRLSFEAAVTRLGGRTLGAENARENSSAKKGESLADVFRVVGCYADAIVVRHHETDEIARALPVSPVPVINAGAGSGEHPTQALLDVYTIRRELGQVDDLSVCVIGDLKYGRTVHSLLRTLAYFRGVRVTLVYPQSLGLPDGLRAELAATGLIIRRETDFRQALRSADVIYQTRIQRERLLDPAEAREAEAFHILPEHLADLQPHARILHPLPRVSEIHPAVDDDERAAYFRQAENGLYMRMALLDDILGGVER
ncbi:MAG: aspartate carbamoyltransferase [Alicyclobacillaceae bacterium]|nr:aspartate carbamoyltransferase [Alicyclobacillaceae bacterium]